jgi:4'-phosphopantetheinyl transferase EntD
MTVGAEVVDRIDAALRSLAPSWVSTGARAIDLEDIDAMWPGERAAVARAVVRRQAEFATGRALLRRLIGEDVEIGVRPDRRPQLPIGVTGTLAHDHEIAVAATTTRPSCRALGVDVEPMAVFAPDEARLVLRPEERHLDGHLVFVLKEAVYKAWSSMGGGMLDHHDVVVDVNESEREFTAVVGSLPATFSGRFIAVDDRYIALAVVEDEANLAHGDQQR